MGSNTIAHDDESCCHPSCLRVKRPFREEGTPSAELRESFWPNLELIDEIATFLWSESHFLRSPKISKCPERARPSPSPAVSGEPTTADDEQPIGPPLFGDKA